MLDLNDRGGPLHRRHDDRQKVQFFDPATHHRPAPRSSPEHQAARTITV
jgi:hypothetical protein